MTICTAQLDGLGEKLTVTSDDMKTSVLIKFDGKPKEFFTREDISNSEKIEWDGWAGNTNPKHSISALSSMRHSKLKGVIRELRAL